MADTSPRSTRSSPAAARYPENPVVVRVWRGDWVESQHRGAWALVDTAGEVIAGGGHPEAPVFARSALKSLQALPLVESGAAERMELTDEELALALASHNAEPRHTAVVLGLLQRLGLAEDDLQCGPECPGDPAARRALGAEGRRPGRVHNNCSGKHAGFLCFAKALGVAPRDYLDPAAEVQQRVRAAVTEMAGLAPDGVQLGVDGCSAPSFRLPLAALARAIARVANPDGLAPARRAACERMGRVVASHPDLLAGTHKRLCTDLARVTGGRLFPKVGADAVYVVGVRGGGTGLAVKIDDGGLRGLHALVLGLCERFELLSAEELAQLDEWRPGPFQNRAGIEVGRLEVVA